MPDSKVLPLARKLVGLAREQQKALDIGAREQFAWIATRREDVTSRLSKLLAAGVVVTPEESRALHDLRTELLAVDQTMVERMRAALKAAGSRQRTFIRTRKAVGAYLQSGPRRGFVDTHQ